MTSTTATATNSFAAVLAQYAGQMSQWVHVLPSLDKAQAAFDALPPDIKSRLAERAARHGLDAVELMQRTPVELWDAPHKLGKFMDVMDISHIKAVSTHPELASDPSNIIWEVSTDNRARGAAEMTGKEFSEATDGARDYARDLTGDQVWWDMNDIFKGMLDGAAVLGYTSVWLPKDAWKEMMYTIRNELPLIDKEQTFAAKASRARRFAKRVHAFHKKHGHQVATAFMLGILTLFWPPATLFVGVWAMTGVLVVALDLLKRVSDSLKQYRFFRFLGRIEMALPRWIAWVKRVRNFLAKIKDGIYTVAGKGLDLFFGAVKAAAKVVKTYVVKTIEKAKNLLSGFISWIFGSRTELAAA